MADIGDQEEVRRLRFWELLDGLATKLEGAVAIQLALAIDKLRREITDAQLDQFIMSGDVEALVSMLDLTGVQLAAREVVSGAAETTILQLPARFQTRFNILNNHSVAALRDFESRAVEVLQNDVKAGVVELLRVGLERGNHPVQTARLIRAQIGLPPKDVRAIANYRAELESGNKTELRRVLERQLRDQRFDRTVLNAISNKQPIDPEKINRMVSRMEERALRVESETISRTASMDAVNVGNRLAWVQLIEDGKVRAETLRRFWVIAGSERTCPRCRPIPRLNPDGVGMDELFYTPEDGMVLIPTIHYRCRCIVYTKIVETLDS